MSEPIHAVDRDACNGDAICVDICPEKVLEMVDGAATTVESRAEKCIECGQCVAVCPCEALEMPKLPVEGFGELGRPPFGYEELLGFLEYRRSVRVFKNRPGPRALIDKILPAAATAPMGMPPHSTEVLVLDRRDELDSLLAELVRTYDSIIRMFSTPFGRTMIRLSKGPEIYRTLRDHVVGVATWANEAYRRDGTDRYMYRAPVVMLFHGSRWAFSYEENAHLVCHHAMLAALSLGLGTTIIGMIPPVVDRSKGLRERYGIPKENRVLTSLILGHPKYRYKRSIHRGLAGVRVM